MLAASLSPTIEESERALNELIFLQRMYDAGAARFFDVMSVQAYGLRNGPDDRRLDLGDVNFSRPLLVRELMVKNGDAAKSDLGLRGRLELPTGVVSRRANLRSRLGGAASPLHRPGAGARPRRVALDGRHESLVLPAPAPGRVGPAVLLLPDGRPRLHPAQGLVGGARLRPPLRVTGRS